MSKKSRCDIIVKPALFCYPVFVVLTKEPTAEFSKIHDRMPVMLPKERIDAWISPASCPEEIVPFALSDMVMEKAED
ncbi:MAG: SOS response-associated peptidase family protein [Lachnospiraceae bacterium]|nr:SOS response-associated peptidase family protein [Lachnospiraceae bacterium]